MAASGRSRSTAPPKSAAIAAPSPRARAAQGSGGAAGRARPPAPPLPTLPAGSQGAPHLLLPPPRIGGGRPRSGRRVEEAAADRREVALAVEERVDQHRVEVPAAVEGDAATRPARAGTSPPNGRGPGRTPMTSKSPKATSA